MKLNASDLGLFNDKEYEVIIEIGMGICLPDVASKYHVKVKIGEFEWETKDPKEYKNGYNRWSERLEKFTIKTKYQSIEEMDKIYIYLMSGTYPICYWKGKVAEFKDPDPS